VLFNDSPDTVSLAAIAAAHLGAGSTSILPTLISGSAAQRTAALAATRAALASGTPGIAGLHIEGPFLAPTRRGIHPLEAMVHPTPADLDALSAPFPAPLLVTLAPERVAAADIARLIAAGCIVFAGHTDADYATTAAAFAAGVRGITHLFNAMSPFAHRAPGAAGAALDCPGAYAGLIADGEHVHPAAVRLAFAAKGPTRICLVSDAQATAASTLTEFTLNHTRITLRDGKLVDEHGTLAGAQLTLAECLRHAVQQIGLPLGACLRMATATPAEAVGLADRGHLAAGQRADLIALDAELNVRSVWLGGEAI
jgi:N-acetylglucosamine-6-phosphate deacetylase